MSGSVGLAAQVPSSIACFCPREQRLWTVGLSDEQDGTIGDGALLAKLVGSSINLAGSVGIHDLCSVETLPH